MDRVKSLLQINLHTNDRPPMLGVEISQHIISQENTIMDLSTLNKGSLVRADEFGHHFLKAVGKQLGNNFIEEVAKRYGP